MTNVARFAVVDVMPAPVVGRSAGKSAAWRIRGVAGPLGKHRPCVDGEHLSERSEIFPVQVTDYLS